MSPTCWNTAISFARRAVAFVQPGDVLMIDSGATTAHFVRRLAVELKDVTVITNSIAHAAVAGSNPSIKVILCPGYFLAGERGTYGPEVAEFLKRYRANQCFVGAGGMTAEGPNDVSAELCWVKRAMIERSGACTLLIDHSKFGHLGLEVICPLDRVTRVVTDRAPPPEHQTSFRIFIIPLNKDFAVSFTIDLTKTLPLLLNPI
jgi:DeoR/GlpR family transcriptional regulator of sugar metabolism